MHFIVQTWLKVLFPANFLSSSQDQGRLHLSDRYICVCVYTYVFNWSLIEGFGVWNMPESLKVAWVQWAPEALLRGSVRWLQRLLQRQRTWDEAPGVKLLENSLLPPGSASASGSCLVMAPDVGAFGHPPTIPVSLRGECPSNCNHRTAPCLDAYTDGAMSALIEAQWRAGLHQVSACHCYLLERVNISVWEELQTSARRRRMLQEWEEAIHLQPGVLCWG